MGQFSSTLLLYLLGAYALGSIPFSVIVSKLRGVDLRRVGSGNYGATNVYRAMGLGWAALVFALDLIKGYIPTYMALSFEFPLNHVLVGAATIVGHSLSVFVKFKGGKGAATGLGVLLALCWEVCLILAVIAALGIALFRMVAPVTILCAILAPFLVWTFNYAGAYIVLVAAISAFIIYRHKSNIVRLIKGEENKV